MIRPSAGYLCISGTSLQRMGGEMKNTALKISSVIFLLVSLAHLLRLAFKINITMGATTIPMWVSVFGFLAPLFFALWIMSLLKK